MKKCAHCDGEGDYLVEEPVVDYVHGGYLKEVRVTCEECNGDCFVVVEDE